MNVTDMEDRRMSVDKGQTYVLTDRAGFTHMVIVDHVAEYMFDDGDVEDTIVDENGVEDTIVDENGFEWPLCFYRVDRPDPIRRARHIFR